MADNGDGSGCSGPVSVHAGFQTLPKALPYNQEREWRRSLVRWRRLAWLLALSWMTLVVGGGLDLDRETLAWVESRYGEAAAQRVRRWRDLMNGQRDLPERDKLALVNSFFNELPWKSDQELWGKKDYWATPIEALGIRGADCEDYSIAKYFTLREMGVPEEKLKIMYVKALKLNQAHMVLTYYPTPDAVPLVLDNINGEILPASHRRDLAPVYSFNASSLWLAKRRGEGKRVGGADRLSLWQDLQQRLRREGARADDR